VANISMAASRRQWSSRTTLAGQPSLAPSFHLVADRGERLDVHRDCLEIVVRQVLEVMVDDLGHASLDIIEVGFDSGFEKLDDVGDTPIAQAGPQIGRDVGNESAIRTVGRPRIGAGCIGRAEKVARRVALAAVRQRRGEIGAAVPLRRSRRIGRELGVVEVEQLPDGLQKAPGERKADVVTPIGLGDRWQGERVGLDGERARPPSRGSRSPGREGDLFLLGAEGLMATVAGFADSTGLGADNLHVTTSGDLDKFACLVVERLCRGFELGSVHPDVSHDPRVSLAAPRGERCREHHAKVVQHLGIVRDVALERNFTLENRKDAAEMNTARLHEILPVLDDLGGIGRNHTHRTDGENAHHCRAECEYFHRHPLVSPTLAVV